MRKSEMGMTSRVVVRVYCDEAGAFHERRGRTQFGPFRRNADGEWAESRRSGTRAIRAADRRPPDPATDPETGEVDASRLPKPKFTGRKPRLSDINPGLRPHVTRYVRRDGQPVAEHEEARVAEAVRRGTWTTALRGRVPADPADMEASQQFAFRCGCGLKRTMQTVDAAEILDSMIAKGLHVIGLSELIRVHEELIRERQKRARRR